MATGRESLEPDATEIGRSTSADPWGPDEHPTHRFLRLCGMLSDPSDAGYRWNFHAGCFDYVGPEITRVLGIGVPEFHAMHRREIRKRIHPQDRHKVKAALLAIRTGGIARLQYRVRMANGTYLWIADTLQILPDADERPQYQVGVLRRIERPAQADGRDIQVGTRRAPWYPIPQHLALPRPLRPAPRRYRRPLAALAAGLALLMAGAVLDRMWAHSLGESQRTPTAQALVNPMPTSVAAEQRLHWQVERLTAEGDRLRRRVAALEHQAARRPAAVSLARAGRAPFAAPARLQAVSARGAVVTHSSKPSAQTRRFHGWFEVPAFQPIAPDPPSSR